MPFTIQMRAPDRTAPEVANVMLRAEALRRFPALHDFPLDHDLIAREIAQVPRQEILMHWQQFELHGDESLGSPTVSLWLSAVSIELPSKAPALCREWLARLQPVLDFFRDHGFTITAEETLLEDYEEQGRRVEHVRRLIHG